MLKIFVKNSYAINDWLNGMFDKDERNNIWEKIYIFLSTSSIFFLQILINIFKVLVKKSISVFIRRRKIVLSKIFFKFFYYSFIVLYNKYFFFLILSPIRWTNLFSFTFLNRDFQDQFNFNYHYHHLGYLQTSLWIW